MNDSANHNNAALTQNLGSGFSGFLATVSHEARFGWIRWLGFATVLSWMFGLFWSDFFAPHIRFVTIDYLQVRSLWLATEAVCLVVIFFLLKKRPGFLAPFSVKVFAGACTAMGTAVLLTSFLGIPSVILCVVGAVFTGVGSSILMLVWGLTLARQGSQSMLLGIGFSFFVASAFDILLVYAPLALQTAVLVLLPLLCVVLFRESKKRAKDEPVVPFILQSSQLESSSTSITWRILILPLLVGLSYGLMQRLAFLGDAVVSTNSDLLTILTFFVTGIISIITAVLVVQSRFSQLIYFLAIPLMVTAFVFFPIAENYREPVQAVFMVGFNYFYFMTWVLWAGDGGGVVPSLERRFAAGFFMLMASESMGSIIGSILVRYQVTSGYTITIISLLVVYLLMMGALFSIGTFFKSGPQTKVAMSDEEEIDNVVQVPHLFEGSLIASYNLSPRECEVLDLLIKGRNRAYISKTLYISDNTTRTHMRNIYSKLNVHSHQELLDFIEGHSPKSS